MPTPTSFRYKPLAGAVLIASLSMVYSLAAYAITGSEHEDDTPEVTNVLSTINLPSSTSITQMKVNVNTLTMDNVINDGDFGAPDTPGSGSEFDIVQQAFTPSQAGNYIFGQSAAPVDTAMLVYIGSFDASNPNNNLIGFNDDYGSPGGSVSDDDLEKANITLSDCGSRPTRCPALKKSLEASQRYVIVISTYNENASLSLPMSFFVYGPGSADFGTTSRPRTRVPAPAPAIIDTSEPFFDQRSPAATASTIQFRGGIFQPSANVTLESVLAIGEQGGSIDASGGDVTVIGDINGVGQLVIDGTGRVMINSTSGVPINVQSGATLGGSGQFNAPLMVAGTLAPGNSPGTLTLTAPLTFAEGATLQMEIDGLGTGNGAGNYDRVILLGEAGTLNAAGTLIPVLRGITGDANNDFTPALGDAFEIIQAQGGVNGTFALQQPTEGLAENTRMDAVYGNNTVTLFVTPERYAALGERGNDRAMGQVWDALREQGSPLVSAFYGQDATALTHALGALSGEIHATSAAAAQDAQQLLGNSWQQQRPGQGVWVNAIDAQQRRSSDDQAVGYRRNVSGVMLGADAQATPALSIGAAFGYADGRANTQGRGSASLEQMMVGARGHYQLNEQRWLDASLLYSHTDIETQRGLGNIAPGTLEADYSANHWAARLGVNQAVVLGEATLTPRAGVRYEHASFNAFNEQPDSPAAAFGALSSESSSDGSWYAELGVSAETTRASEHSGWYVTPQLGLHLQEAVSSTDATRELSWQGQRYQQVAAQRGDTTLSWQLGLSAGKGEHFSTFVNYEGESASGFEGHQVNAGIQYRW